MAEKQMQASGWRQVFTRQRKSCRLGTARMSRKLRRCWQKEMWSGCRKRRKATAPSLERGNERNVIIVQAGNSKDAKEIAALLAEENVELVPEEDRDKLQELDSLTGQPRATDTLLYAIPVSASLFWFYLHLFRA